MEPFKTGSNEATFNMKGDTINPYHKINKGLTWGTTRRNNSGKNGWRWTIIIKHLRAIRNQDVKKDRLTQPKNLGPMPESKLKPALV